MAEASVVASVIELRAGQGEPRQISLTPGSVLDPTSVGQTAMWRIEGAGVLDVHGYLYFDGKALFVQSADDETPVMVNRHRIARAWTEVRMPSTIELGEAQLVYRIDTAVFEDADQTVAQPLDDSFEPKTVRFDPNRHGISAPRPAAGTPAEGVAAPPRTALMAAQPQQQQPRPASFVPNVGAFSQGPVDDESTRYKPLDVPPDRASQPALIPGGPPPGLPGTGPGADMTRVQPAEQRPPMQQQGYDPNGAGMMGGQPQGGYPQGAGLPPGMMGMGGQPGMATPPPGQQGWGSQTGPVAGQVGAQTAAAATSPIEKLKQEFKSFSPVKRLALVLMVVALPVGGLLLFSDDAEAPKPEARPKATASASVSSAGGQPPPASNSAAQGATGGPQAVNSGGAGATPPPASANPTPPPPANTPPPPAGKPAPDPAASVMGKLPSDLPALMPAIPMPAKKSLERLAADAVVEGKFGDAAKLYEQLAQQNPGNPAYKEAARIMRESSRGGP